MLIALARDHSPLLVAAAILVCVATAWSLVALLDRAAIARTGRRLGWTTLAALVAGLGIWATHFVAALGFRPDFAFVFDPRITAWSATVGILAIGIPASATAVTRRRSLQAVGGAFAGLGVTALHATGMAAMTNCIVQPSPGPTVAVAFVGAALMATALAMREERQRGWTVGLIVLAVVTIHFGLIAASDVFLGGDAFGGVDRWQLGLLVGLAALVPLLAAGYVVNASAKLEVQVRHGTLISTALSNMSNGLVLIGADDRIELFNDRVLALFGLAAQDIAVGMRWQRYLANLAPHLGWSAVRLDRVIANHERWFTQPDTTYLEHVLDDGRTISVACRPVTAGGAVLTYDDVTAERHAQREVERLAFLDPLTGLTNRRSLRTNLDRIFAEGTAASLLLLDLDRFKNVNDTIGHAAGDELLGQVARRLEALCDEGEDVARMAGDEFAIVVPGARPERDAELSARVIAGLGEPFAVAGQSVTVGCSVGVATTADARTAEDIVQFADLALFRAKGLGRGQSCGYEPGMREDAVRRSELEADLRRALNGDRFELLYQPIHRLGDRWVIGFEALIRWHHPTRGTVSPAEFIPIAEETGLIAEIGLWIVRVAAREVRCWPESVHVAINVSPVQFRDSRFPEQVIRLLDEAGVAPSRLEIELTETAMVGDSRQIANGLRMLRQAGIRIAMDDFGTGYSSFAHLRDFDLDWIKIDQSFVRAAPTDPGAAAVLRAVIQMAEGLGVGTIGEGVETEEQLAALLEAGCTAAQGYFLGRPMAGERARELVRCDPAR